MSLEKFTPKLYEIPAVVGPPALLHLAPPGGKSKKKNGGEEEKMFVVSLLMMMIIMMMTMKEEVGRCFCRYTAVGKNAVADSRLLLLPLHCE